MKYEGYMVGPALRKLRTDRGLSILQASNLSTSSLNQIEQGGRNLSMKSLFLFMNAYDVDANTVLDIKTVSNKEDSIDSRLAMLPDKQRAYFRKTFSYMLDNAANMIA